MVFQSFCLPCHGAAGEGNATVKAPSIAGLPEWYVVLQLEKFRSGVRGAHAHDLEGQIMRSIALGLDAKLIKEVASHISTLPMVRPTAVNKTDAAAGRVLYEERCMECHRFNGAGEVAFLSPPLTGLQDWYLAAQMRKFKRGIRGADAQDEAGRKMVTSAGCVEDEQALASLVAYILSLGREPKLQKAE